MGVPSENGEDISSRYAVSYSSVAAGILDSKIPLVDLPLISNFDKARGIIGHECMNELIVDRLLTILGIPHLAYQLIHADVTVDGKMHEVYLCASEDFKAKSETKIALGCLQGAGGTTG